MGSSGDKGETLLEFDQMKSFENFLERLLKNPSSDTVVIVRGARKKAKAMIRLTSKNYLDAEYIKIIFDDGSFLLILPAEQEIYFAGRLLGAAEGITDEMIGRDQRITYKGKVYELGNKDDYQFVKQLYVGSPLDIEGECRFSDYFPVEGPKEFLSLGWLARTGERADINCQIIDNGEVDLA